MLAQQTAVSEIVQAYWPILVCSFLGTLIATPLCRRFALRKNIVDRPDDWLKPHKKPVPYLGGVAVFVGWSLGIALTFLLFTGSGSAEAETTSGLAIDRAMMIGALAAGLGIMCLGLFDDLRLLSPIAKLIGIAAATTILIAVGIGDDTIRVVLKQVRVTDLNDGLIFVYSVPLTLFITMGACNATNLIDGVDGLCSGVMGIIAAAFLVLSVHLHCWSDWHPWHVERVTLSLALMGACLGFLPYNRNPARIFLGDAGSMLLGLNAAMMILLFSKSNAIRWLLASVMVFGLPLADLLLTLARRWRNQRPIMKGDRSHFYDQLIDRGWPVRRVVGLSYLLAAFFGVIGCLSILLRTRYSVLLYFAVFLGILYVVAKARMVRLEEQSAPEKASDRQT